jgi:hypothetical protein
MPHVTIRGRDKFDLMTLLRPQGRTSTSIQLRIIRMSAKDENA